MERCHRHPHWGVEVILRILHRNGSLKIQTTRLLLFYFIRRFIDIRGKLWRISNWVIWDNSFLLKKPKNENWELCDSGYDDATDEYYNVHCNFCAFIFFKLINIKSMVNFWLEKTPDTKPTKNKLRKSEEESCSNQVFSCLLMVGRKWGM